MRKFLSSIDVINLLLLHSIVEEHLESLVDHGGFLFLRDVPSPEGITGAKHLLEVESVAGIFESLRPIDVVAVFWWRDT